MAGKVPKFGAWEGGENFTVYFDNARIKKQNGPIINPNDPQENPDMFPQKRGGEAEEGQQGKVPQFGAWDNGDNVGYTMYFENARKNKTNGGGPEPEPKLKPGPQETRPKVPPFGGWGDQGGGEVAYTMCFDNVRKNKGNPPHAEEPSRKNKGSPPNVEEPSRKNKGSSPPDVEEPQLNRDAGPTTQDARVKLPEFGGWNGGEESTVAYTACFDNPRKNKSGGTGPVLVDPQLNRDVRHGTRHDGRNASRGSIGSTVDSERNARQAPVGQSPLHHKGGRTNHSKSGGRGGQIPEKVATIPPFGVWNEDPSKADGFTGTFEKAKVDRLTPLHKNAPPSNNHQTQSKEERKGCWYACFG